MVGLFIVSLIYQIKTNHMRTPLPTEIKTPAEAEIFLRSLYNNNEVFHPEDRAEDIIWDTTETPTPEECKLLNKLMQDIYSLGAFDPCEFILNLNPEFNKIEDYITIKSANSILTKEENDDPRMYELTQTGEIDRSTKTLFSDIKNDWFIKLSKEDIQLIWDTFKIEIDTDLPDTISLSEYLETLHTFVKAAYNLNEFIFRCSTDGFNEIIAKDYPFAGDFNELVQDMHTWERTQIKLIPGK